MSAAVKQIQSQVALDNGLVTVTLDNGQVVRVLWVTLEGPIGAGKTELTKVMVPALEKEYGSDAIFYVAEPIDELMATGLFQDYQHDPHRWAFEFQTTCFDMRTDYFRRAWDRMLLKLGEGSPLFDRNRKPKTVILLSERSIVSDVCFMKVQRACNHVSEDTLQRYLNLNSKWRELYKGARPGLVIYCRPGTGDSLETLNVCQARIRERNREAEQELVTRGYNGMVLDAHNQVFGKDAVFFPSGFGQRELKIPVVSVDTTENYRDDERVALKKSGELLQHIRTIVTELPPGWERLRQKNPDKFTRLKALFDETAEMRKAYEEEIDEILAQNGPDPLVSCMKLGEVGPVSVLQGGLVVCDCEESQEIAERMHKMQVSWRWGADWATRTLAPEILNPQTGQWVPWEAERRDAVNDLGSGHWTIAGFHGRAQKAKEICKGLSELDVQWRYSKNKEIGSAFPLVFDPTVDEWVLHEEPNLCLAYDDCKRAWKVGKDDAQRDEAIAEAMSKLEHTWRWSATKKEGRVVPVVYDKDAGEWVFYEGNMDDLIFYDQGEKKWKSHPAKNSSSSQ